MSSSGNVMGIFEICLLSMKRGLLTFQGALHKKVPKKKETSKRHVGRVHKRISSKKSQKCFRGTYIFSFELGFYVNANTDNFY